MFRYNVSNIDKNYNFFINGVSTASSPMNNTIIFLNKNKNEYLEKLSKINESIIILLSTTKKERVSKISNSNLIIFSNNPRLEYAKLLYKVLKETGHYNRKNFTLKDGYYYGENVKVGENVIIEPFVRIGSNVEIGNNTVIKSGAIINDNIKIGNNCYIKSNCVIGGEGYGIEKDTDGKTYRIPHIGGVEIGNNVEIGALATVCLGTIGKTIIKDYTIIDDHVHISHNVLVGEGTFVVAGSFIGGSVKIGKNSYLGLGCVVKNKLTLGENSKVSMGAVVVTDVKDNETVTGNFAMPHMKFLEKYLLEIENK